MVNSHSLIQSSLSLRSITVFVSWSPFATRYYSLFFFFNTLQPSRNKSLQKSYLPIKNSTFVSITCAPLSWFSFRLSFFFLDSEVIQYRTFFSRSLVWSQTVKAKIFCSAPNLACHLSISKCVLATNASFLPWFSCRHHVHYSTRCRSPRNPVLISLRLVLYNIVCRNTYMIVSAASNIAQSISLPLKHCMIVNGNLFFYKNYL